MDISRKILLGAVDAGRIPNAYLFSGAESKALFDEAIFLADALHCKSPDLIVISSSGKSIKIDEIRQIASLVKYGPALCPWKVIIIQDADMMTEEAANSFLKTLEEPHSNILFILTTIREPHILKTIASRCQKVIFSSIASQSDESAKEITEKIMNAKNMEIPELLAFSEELSSSENLDQTLNSVLNSISSYHDHKPVREIFNAVRSLERKANKKLTMDNMFLSIKEAF